MTIIEAIDTIESPILRAFMLRFYNSFVAFIGPALVTGIGLFIESQPEPFLISMFFSWEALSYILGATAVSILGSTVAGAFKANRAAKA